jgi:hypothetical protein
LDPREAKLTVSLAPPWATRQELAVPTSFYNTVDSHSAPVAGADEDAVYRTPSILAIVSLVFGLASPLSMFAPLLLVIPLTGVALALLALRRIALSDGALIGRTAAVLALALAVASVSATFTRTAVAQELLSRQARATAFQWIEFLQRGDAEKAFQMTAASRQAARPREPDAPSESGNEPTKSPLETFRSDPVVHFISNEAKGVPVSYVEDMVADSASVPDARVQQKFTVGVPAEIGDSPTTGIELILQRQPAYNQSPTQWIVSAYKSDELPAQTP